MAPTNKARTIMAARPSSSSLPSRTLTTTTADLGVIWLKLSCTPPPLLLLWASLTEGTQTDTHSRQPQCSQHQCQTLQFMGVLYLHGPEPRGRYPLRLVLLATAGCSPLCTHSGWFPKSEVKAAYANAAAAPVLAAFPGPRSRLAPHAPAAAAASDLHQWCTCCC